MYFCGVFANNIVKLHAIWIICTLHFNLQAYILHYVTKEHGLYGWVQFWTEVIGTIPGIRKCMLTTIQMQKKFVQVDVKKSSGKLVWLNTSCHPIKQAADIWQDIATRCGQQCLQSFVCHVTNCCYKCCTLTNTLDRTAHRAQALNLCLRETHQVDCICCCAIAGHGELLSHEWLPHTATSCLARAHAI